MVMFQLRPGREMQAHLRDKHFPISAFYLKPICLLLRPSFSPTKEPTKEFLLRRHGIFIRRNNFFLTSVDWTFEFP